MPILQRGRRPGLSSAASGPSEASSSRSAAPASAAGHPPTVDLPPYQPRLHVLDDTAKRELYELKDGRNGRKLEAHVVKSMAALADGVAGINDRVTDRRQHVEALETRLAKSSQDDEDGEAQVQAQREYLRQLEAKVSKLTERSERAFRELIDFKAEIQDEKDVLGAVWQQVGTQRPRERAARAAGKAKRPKPERGSGDEDDEEEDDDREAPAVDQTPYPGTVEMLEASRTAKQDDYQSMTVRQRYAENNDYISFKSKWHFALNSQDVPVPHSSKWFDKDGNPIMCTSNGGAGGAGAEDEDEELVVVQEKLDPRCPLSQAIMKEPYTNRNCKHTFEKSSIWEYIESIHDADKRKCPKCDVVTLIKKSDFYFDDVKLLRIQAQLREAEGGAQDEDEDGDSDDEEFEDINASMTKRERRAVDDDIEDDDDEV